MRINVHFVLLNLGLIPRNHQTRTLQRLQVHMKTFPALTASTLARDIQVLIHATCLSILGDSCFQVEVEGFAGDLHDTKCPI